MSLCSGERGMWFMPYGILREKDNLVAGAWDVPEGLFLQQGVLDR